MNEINLNAFRDRAYKTACEHGFHDTELSNEHLLCLVISELMEAVEADRVGKHSELSLFKKWLERYDGNVENIGFIRMFDDYIKDSIEDELSDAAIRLLDLAGLRKIDINNLTEEDIDDLSESCNGETFTESVYAISTIPIRYEYEYGYSLDKLLNGMLLAIFGLAKYLNIDLMWHVNQKMRYNELRKNKHGKKY